MSLQNLKDVLADLIPKEQSRIKNFKQQYGKTNIGQITVDMVSRCWGAVGAQCLIDAPNMLQLIFFEVQSDNQEVTSGPGSGGEGHFRSSA